MNDAKGIHLAKFAFVCVQWKHKAIYHYTYLDFYTISCYIGLKVKKWDKMHWTYSFLCLVITFKSDSINSLVNELQSYIQQYRFQSISFILRVQVQYLWNTQTKGPETQ